MTYLCKALRHNWQEKPLVSRFWHFFYLTFLYLFICGCFCLSLFAFAFYPVHPIILPILILFAFVLSLYSLYYRDGSRAIQQILLCRCWLCRHRGALLAAIQQILLIVVGCAVIAARC